MSNKRNRQVQAEPASTTVITKEVEPIQEDSSPVSEANPVEEIQTEVTEEQPASVVAEDTVPHSQPTVEATATVTHDNLEMTVGTASTTVITKEVPKQVDAGLVKVLISYPEGYAGTKYLQNGKTYEVSKESADLFVSKGIGQIIKS
jgi:hypothetical protein